TLEYTKTKGDSDEEVIQDGVRVFIEKKALMLLNCGVEEDLTIPWRARRSNQSILKEINPEYSLQELMLKLKRQHFGHLLRRAG
ncbi:hypothetical protein ABTM65_19665, partial [Acinetobacter baumannii]